MSTILLGLAAFLGGVLNTVQSGCNSTLAKGLGQPVTAALFVAAGNVVVYLAVAPFLGLGWPGADKAAAVPWWAWIGGLLGAAYVLATILVAEKIGAAIFIGLTVTAGIITSVTLDHFGLVGFQVHTAGIGRLAGAGLMIAGLTLVCLF